jgi:dTDP-glucose 4,6-dehydratase
MKLLVFGGKGWIGQQFIKLAHESGIVCMLAETRPEQGTAKLREEIKSKSATHVVSMIGRTHGAIEEKVFSTIDYLEQPGKLMDNVRDNLFAPVVMAMVCKDLDVHLTYLGTGCIFEYDQDHPFGIEEKGFLESDTPNFFGSGYSTVKGFTDRLMHEMESTVLNLRIRMPITAEANPRDFISKITTYQKICSVPNSMTVLPDILPIVVDMIRNSKTGTYNMTNPGLISHNEILEMYKRIVDPSFSWQNFSREEQDKILASGRSNNFLDTSKLEKEYPQIKPIHLAVKECLSAYPKPPKIRILVTGGCGFIGSNFVNYAILNRPDWYIVNIDAMYYCASHDYVISEARTSGRYTFIHGNIRDSNLISHILTSRSITHVLHFAAQSHVQNSFKDASTFIMDNVLGTQTLLECTRNYGKLQKFVHVSTDEVYGEALDTKMTETSVLCPTNPYAASKAGAELMASAYAHSYGIPLIVTRGNNVYGSNQHHEKLIPCFIKKSLNGEKLPVQGDGSARRAFMYVSDTVRAFECILDKGVIGEIYNIGCDEGVEYTVLEVAEMIVKLIHQKDVNLEDHLEFIPDRPYNDKRYYISNDKLKALGWTQLVGFENGLKKIISGYNKLVKYF